MVLKSRKRRYEFTHGEIYSVLEDVEKGNKSKEEAAQHFKIPVKSIDELEEVRQVGISKQSEKSLVKLPKTSDDKYDSDIQKIVSFKGVIRPLTLSVTNKAGGKYLMKVINIYVKPNSPKTRIQKDADGKPKKDEYGRFVRVPITDSEGNPVIRENTRYYEEKVYSVDKGAIKRGRETEFYYPDKARWSKEPGKTHAFMTESVSKGNEEIALRRKIKRKIVVKRPTKSSKTVCKCIKRKK